MVVFKLQIGQQNLIFLMLTSFYSTITLLGVCFYTVYTSVVVFFLLKVVISASVCTQLSHSCKALTVLHHWPLQLDISSLGLVPR